MPGKKIPHPKSTNFDDDRGVDFPMPPAKRAKHDTSDSPSKFAKKDTKPNTAKVIPDSEEDTDNEDLQAEPRERKRAQV